MSSADFFNNFFYNFSKNSFRNTIRVSNSLSPDQAQHFIGPDLGPNCLQKLTADDTRTKEAKSQEVASWNFNIFLSLKIVLIILTFHLSLHYLSVFSFYGFPIKSGLRNMSDINYAQIDSSVLRIYASDICDTC